MNNSLHTTIHEWLIDARARLKGAGVESYHLDALLLLEHILGVSRAHLLAHPELLLSKHQLTMLNAYLERRCAREPLAYILGTIEFYGRNFMVNHDVLVPRPESEAIIEELKRLALEGNEYLVDVGTGSGILGITAALERPGFIVDLADVSPSALDIAMVNAHSHNIRARRVHCDLLSSYLKGGVPRISIILANLPYVDPSWKTSPEIQHEPQTALFAADGGLEYIKRLIIQTEKALKNNGYLLLEADPSQFKSITHFGSLYGLTETSRNGYCLVLRKTA